MAQNFTTWTNEPATDKQLAYIEAMREYSPHHIPKFDGTTKGEAARYIDKYVWPIYNYTSKLDELEQANIEDKDIRLIDANALIDNLYRLKEEANLWVPNGQGGVEPNAATWDEIIQCVDLQSTIKAVPVEWIKMKQHQYSGKSRIMEDTYAAVLGEWLDEKGEAEE